VAHEFLEFVRGAELIIHNAPFDVGFLDHELRLMDLQPITEHCPQITDTLRMARDLHPGKRNGLDALCERYQVDNSARTLHGALLDAELLAEVYLSMTRGQETLLMDLGPATRGAGEEQIDLSTFELVVLPATQDELAAHMQQLAAINKASKGACLWMRLEAAAVVAVA
jgi:DNA polymerase-3 subunit epsilon